MLASARQCPRCGRCAKQKMAAVVSPRATTSHEPSSSVSSVSKKWWGSHRLTATVHRAFACGGGPKLGGATTQGSVPHFSCCFSFALSFLTLFFVCVQHRPRHRGGFPNHFCDENVRRHHRHLLLAACKPLRWLHAMECRYLHARVNRRNYPIVCCRQ